MRYKHYLLVLGLAASLAPAADLLAQQGTVTRTVIIRRGWLGINYDMISENRDGKTTESMTVLDVVEGSPADRAGVRKGDRIVRIEGRPVTIGRFEALSREIEPGDTVQLRVSNNGRERDLNIVATERPAEFAMPLEPRIMFERGLQGDSVRSMLKMYFDSARIKIDGLPTDSFFFHRLEAPFRGRIRIDSLGGRDFQFFSDSMPRGLRIEVLPRGLEGELPFPNFDILMANSAVAGAEFTELNPGLGQYFGVSKGLLVTRVAPGTPAAQAGLESGDVLTRIDGSEATNVEAFRRALLRSRESAVKLEIVRKGKTHSLNLQIKSRRE